MGMSEHTPAWYRYLGCPSNNPIKHILRRRGFRPPPSTRESPDKGIKIASDFELSKVARADQLSRS